MAETENLYTFCVSAAGCMLVAQVSAPNVEKAIHLWIAQADVNLRPYLKDERRLRRTLASIAETADLTEGSRLTGLKNAWSTPNRYGKKLGFDLYIVQTDPVGPIG